MGKLSNYMLEDGTHENIYYATRKIFDLSAECSGLSKSMIRHFCVTRNDFLPYSKLFRPRRGPFILWSCGVSNGYRTG